MNKSDSGKEWFLLNGVLGTCSGFRGLILNFRFVISKLLKAFDLDERRAPSWGKCIVGELYYILKMSGSEGVYIPFELRWSLEMLMMITKQDATGKILLSKSVVLSVCLCQVGMTM